MEHMVRADTILIVDGHGLAYRAFHALPPLNAPDGTPTSAIAGTMDMLLRARDALSRDASTLHCVVAFDSPGPTFRHDLFPQYKSSRARAPDDLRAQIPILRELLELMGFPVLATAGVEADDIIGSLAVRVADTGRRAVILSSDKDLLQLLGDGIVVLRPGKAGATTLWDAASFEAERGFPPSSMPDYLAILGDASDDVPGVRGIGEKGATRLVSKWGTLERMFASLDDVEPALRKKLEAAGLESALMSRSLIQLKLDVPVDLDACLALAPRPADALALARRLALSKIVRRLQAEPIELVPPAPTPQGPAPRPVAPEDLPSCEELAIAASGEGTYHVAAPDGACATCPVASLSSLIERTRPEKILVDDLKTLLRREGDVSGAHVWDLRTARYVLHPDRAADAHDPLPSDAPAVALFALRDELDAEIDRHEGLRAVMEELDVPLLPVLDRMERWGVGLDDVRAAELQRELEDRVATICARVAAAAGEEIDLASPKQVGELLFDRLGFAPEERTKGKGAWSTKASVLERLARGPGGEVPAMILEHRELSKMLSGFVVPLRLAARAGGGTIHTTFEAASTGTGRLSSRDPNLQNVPAFGAWARQIKEALVPVRAGDVFVAADWSQIELRILAHMSQEPRLIDAFQRGEDPHRQTAAWAFSIPPEDVGPELRRTAKTINFGLLYGMGAFGLAERLGVSRGEASAIVERWSGALPRVRAFLKDVVAEAKARGHARTLMGRIRPVEAIGARGPALDRVLVNAPIQGTAADIARRAMIAFDRAFAGDDEVHLFLQVHDSLVCECPPHRAEDVARALREIMMGAASLSVPLDVDVETGPTLADV